MKLSRPLQAHYSPQKGWINDPNGLCYFQGYYHLFYQHAPDYERPWRQPMHWGHARTQDFIHWEELPVALYPDQWYDAQGCFSGTALVKEDTLYLFYASIQHPEGAETDLQTVSVAYSKDGIHFEKFAGNPVISHYPPEGSPDFRDPAVSIIGNKAYCVMASAHVESKEARLLLYESDDLFTWRFANTMCRWENGKFAECPSFMAAGDQYLLTASVCPLNAPHYFRVMYGSFENGVFTPQIQGNVDQGPDQYAGQVFTDPQGRQLLITWIPGWHYAGKFDRDIGCMSVPRELFIRNGKVCAYPVKEVQHLLKDHDPALERTENGFIIHRETQEDVIYAGEIRELKILRDQYILEVFINGGETVYTAVLC